MANPKPGRQSRRAAKYKKPSERGRPLKEEEHLVQPFDASSGVIHRNSTHRPDARKEMKSIGIYDDDAQIRKAIENQPTIKAMPDSHKEKEIKARIKKYTLNYVNKTDNGAKYKNFSSGEKPYPNSSHHIMVIEMFSTNQGWTNKQRAIVRETGYNINNEFNIVYLPFDSSKDISQMCEFHDLPNHAKGHYYYNKDVVTKAKNLQKLAQKAIDQSKDKTCKSMDKMKILDQMWTYMINTEDHYFKKVMSMGPGPIGKKDG